MLNRRRTAAVVATVVVLGAAFSPVWLSAGASSLVAQSPSATHLDSPPAAAFQGVTALPRLASLKSGAVGLHHVVVEPLFYRKAPSEYWFKGIARDVGGFYARELPGTHITFSYEWPKQVARAVACTPKRAMSYALARSGADLSRPRMHVLAWAPECPASGYAWHSTGNGLMWLGGLQEQLLAHEFGHNLGLLHSNAVMCRDSMNQLVALSDRCTEIAYADPFSVMGTRCNLTKSCRLAGPDIATLTGRAVEIIPGKTHALTLVTGGTSGPRTAYLRTSLGIVYFDAGPRGNVPDVGPVSAGVQVRILTRAGNAIISVPDVAAGPAGLPAASLLPLDAWTIPNSGIRVIVLAANDRASILQFVSADNVGLAPPAPVVTSATKVLFNDPYLLRWTSHASQRDLLGFVVGRVEAKTTSSYRVDGARNSMSLAGITTSAGASIKVWAISRTGVASEPSVVQVRTNPDFIRFAMNGNSLKSSSDDPLTPTLSARVGGKGVLRWKVDANQSARITGWSLHIELHDGTWINFRLPAKARQLVLSPRIIHSIHDSAAIGAPYVDVFFLPQGISYGAEILLRG